jgi:hypothetical protein
MHHENRRKNRLALDNPPGFTSLQNETSNRERTDREQMVRRSLVDLKGLQVLD